MSRSIAYLLTVFLVTGQAGCAPIAPQAPLLPPPPSEQIRSQLGTVGVVSGSYPPEFDTAGPAKGPGGGALRGAGMGAGSTIAFGALGGGYGIVFGALLSPVGAVVGSVVGAFKADPAAIVTQHEGAARQILANRALQDALRDRLAAAGRVQTRGKFVVLTDDRGPGTRNAQVDYAALAQEGIHTVLEVTVDDVYLDGWGINPPLSLRMTARTRLVRTAGNLELYASSLTYAGAERHTLEERVARAGEVLRQELQRADAILAEKIVDEVFLVMLFPARSPRK